MEMVEQVKYSNLLDVCGEPGNKTDFIKAPFPFTMYLNGNKNQPCRNFYGNKRIYPAVFDALSEIMDIFGLDFIIENGLDNYGGCYSLRATRGGTRMSDHSWGLAIDYLPQLGKLGKPSLIPFHIVQSFINRGFVWGGNWSRTDGMHFSGVTE